jgi:lipoate-protein ligase A
MADEQTSWRLLIDQPRDGASNMALDDALLEAQAAGAAPPTLRLYRWAPACLSLGRFQRGAEIDRGACARAGVPVVRRPSGGRALLHDDELTYALALRADHPALAGADSILESYRRISAALLAGLRLLGVPAELAPAARRRGASAACFDTPASYELTVEGRKLVGSAQARRDGALLQHGAIPLTPHADRLSSLLVASPPDLDRKMIAVDQALGRSVAFDTLAGALAEGFRAAWGIRLEPGAWSAAELGRAEELRRARYNEDDWTWGR